MQFAVVQFNIAWEDKPANHATMERMIAEADLEPGAFVVLPELGDTGFSFDLEAIVDDASLDWGQAAAKRFGIWLQVGYAGRAEDGTGRNRAAIITPAGDVSGVYEKVHPFSYGRESEHYSGGDHLLVRTCGDLRVCPIICYDLRFPELWRLSARAGAEVFTIGASWPAARQTHWRALLVARAIENQAFVVAVNRVGSDPHLPYAGGSMIIAPTGEVLAEAGDEPAVLKATLDPSVVREWRSTFPALRDRHDEFLGAIPIDE